jgi:hypothetical protein
MLFDLKRTDESENLKSKIISFWYCLFRYSNKKKSKAPLIFFVLKHVHQISSKLDKLFESYGKTDRKNVVFLISRILPTNLHYPKKNKHIQVIVLCPELTLFKTENSLSSTILLSPGITTAKAAEDGCYVEVGLKRPCLIKQKIIPNVRVTLKLLPKTHDDEKRLKGNNYVHHYSVL